VTRLVVAALLAGLFSSEPIYFQVSARFEPAAKDVPPAVVVTFTQGEAGVHINEHPAPQFALAADQAVLDYQRPVAKPMAIDPAQVKALDLSKPVRFPVSIRAGAAKGSQPVKGTVTYFYCSEREHWCRRGNEEVAFTVVVP
jgi:hypothetical protein